MFYTPMLGMRFLAAGGTVHTSSTCSRILHSFPNILFLGFFSQDIFVDCRCSIAVAFVRSFS